MICENISVGRDGKLSLSGLKIEKLAQDFGTPLYLLDEKQIRTNCRKYTQAFRKHLPDGSRPLFASKALCIKALYPILLEEGLGADVVSAGELFTALSAGFPADRIFFHGDNKLLSEIELAVSSGVGCIVADSAEELALIDSAAEKHGITQTVLLRITPNIDPHTFDAVNTGKMSCQFGVSAERAESFTAAALQCRHIRLKGFHCHIGSQIFGHEPFILALDIMIDLMVRVRDTLGYTAEYLNLGGGYGVRYTENDPVVDIPDCIAKTGEHLRLLCEKAGYPLPAVFKEPGRSIVADAGITLYTAGRVKKVSESKSFIIVDGGMTDNPRYALYSAPYTVINATRYGEKADRLYTVAGRCCESGDIIQSDVSLPETRPGDILAVLNTGAYNYSMSSNYNRIPRPPMVMVSEGTPRLVVRGETPEDLIRNDL